MTTNPWHASNPYIKYLNTNFPFSRTKLEREGYQWKAKGKELFHYANYRINPVISAKDVETLEMMKWEDENEWKIISLGLPGVPSGGVYTHLLKNVSRILQDGDIYTCGIDFGFMHDQMAIILSRYFKYFAYVVLIFAILYKYEISSDKKTFVLTKKATLQYNRSYVYKIITNINKYPVVC